MNIIYVNESDYAISIYTDSDKEIRINSKSSQSIECAETDRLNVAVKRDAISSKIKSKYNLVLETLYQIEDISDNVILKITHQVDEVGLRAKYDRLFISSETATCTEQSYNVLGAEEVKKHYKKCRLADRLWWDIWFEFLEAFVVLSVFGMIIIQDITWKVVLVSAPIAYIVVYAFDQISSKLFGYFFKRVFKEKINEKTVTEFNEYFENEYICEYYDNLEKT